MSASIVLSDLAWSTPDGKSLFHNLDLSFGSERCGLVGRNGVGKTTLLRLITGELRPQRGAVAILGRLALLRQAVQPGEEETIASLFGVEDALAVLARVEAGQGGEEDFAAADWTLEARMASALGRLGLEAEPHTPLASLSGGQRTRASLAALVFAEPDFMILDEPTNNLDRDGRDAVIGLLADWRAGAIIISHDRDLLETMDAIVELTPLGAARYGGPWSFYRERKALELDAARHDLADAEKRLVELSRGAQAAAERKARKDGAGRRKAARGDEPRILLGAMKDRSEATGGERARLVERRREQALAVAASARERIEVLQPLKIDLPSTGLPAQKEVLSLERVSVGYTPGCPVIENLSFAITGPERVAVVGPNGSGKTTLLGLVAGAREPWTGRVRTLTTFAMLDQDVGVLDAEASILDNFRRINPGAGENACRAALARFMFRAGAALQKVSTLSGGQVLRVGLACVLGGREPPGLLVLDEPTNHLDFESTEVLEAGLGAYDGALLVVSHDEGFLSALGVTRRITLGGPREQTS